MKTDQGLWVIGMRKSAYPAGRVLGVLMLRIILTDAHAADPWQFTKTFETGRLTENRFFLNTAADVNGNGLKELIVADFGQYGEPNDSYRPKREQFNLFVFEWDTESDKLIKKWQKHWDWEKFTGDDERYFYAWKAERLVALPTDGRVFVETWPPFLGLEWSKGNYRLHEQHKPREFYDPKKGEWLLEAKGSWVLPWESYPCHLYWRAYPDYPQECLVGIRDFFRNGKLRIVTYHVTEERDRMDRLRRIYKVTLRVRRWEPGFPIEWETPWPRRLGSWLGDRFAWKLSDPLAIYEFGGTAEMRKVGKFPVFLLDPDPSGKGYRTRYVDYDQTTNPPIAPLFYGWWDQLVGHTRDNRTLDTWGYYQKVVKVEDVPKELQESEGEKAYEYIRIPIRTTLRPDLKGWTWELIDFPHHDKYIGVGHMRLADLDGDGLDEAIFVEQTGDRTFVGDFDHGQFEYTNVKDYIRILKWNGKEYQTMWLSPPYTERATKIIVDDIKGNGQKQLVLMTGKGTIEVWERK